MAFDFTKNPKEVFADQPGEDFLRCDTRSSQYSSRTRRATTRDPLFARSRQAISRVVRSDRLESEAELWQGMTDYWQHIQKAIAEYE